MTMIQPASIQHPIHHATQQTLLRQNLSSLVGAEKSVMAEYDQFTEQLSEGIKRGWLSEDEVAGILDALSYAAERHQGQVRKGAEKIPYIIHPMGVSRQILSLAGVADPAILKAALLHDVVEDTFAPEESEKGFLAIRERFGEVVEGYVREVSDDKKLPKAERKQQQIDHAPHNSFGATAIKLSDKLYNLTDLAIAPPAEWKGKIIEEYALWSSKVVNALPYTDTPPLNNLKIAVDAAIERLK